jgi:hypothetical protein
MDKFPETGSEFGKLKRNPEHKSFYPPILALGEPTGLATDFFNKFILSRHSQFHSVNSV